MNVITFFLRLFRREKSIEKIVSPITKIVADLQAYENEEFLKSSEALDRAAEEKRKAEAAAANATRASQLSEKYGSLLLG